MCQAGCWTTSLRRYCHKSPKTGKRVFTYISVSKHGAQICKILLYFVLVCKVLPGVNRVFYSKRVCAGGFLSPCGTHNAVEAVEGGVEVGLPAEAIHLYKHLRQEDPQKDEFSKI